MNAILTTTGLAGAFGTGLIFVEAGIAKLRHRELVPGVVANYRLLPEALVGPVAALLPPVELLTGLALVAGALDAGGPVGQILRPAALVAVVLLLAFAGAMAINIRRGRGHIDCGCGRSQLRQTLSPALVVRNLVLAVLVGVHALPDAPADGLTVALGLASGLCLFLFFLLFNALVALAASPLSAGRR